MGKWGSREGACDGLGLRRACSGICTTEKVWVCGVHLKWGGWVGIIADYGCTSPSPPLAFPLPRSTQPDRNDNPPPYPRHEARPHLGAESSRVLVQGGHFNPPCRNTERQTSCTDWVATRWTHRSLMRTYRFTLEDAP